MQLRQCDGDEKMQQRVCLDMEVQILQQFKEHQNWLFFFNLAKTKIVHNFHNHAQNHENQTPPIFNY